MGLHDGNVAPAGRVRQPVRRSAGSTTRGGRLRSPSSTAALSPSGPPRANRATVASWRRARHGTNVRCAVVIAIGPHGASTVTRSAARGSPSR